MTGDLRQRKTWNRIMERIQPGICWRGHRTGLGRNSKPFIYIDKLTNVSNPCLSHLQNGRKGVLRRLLFRIARDKKEIAGLLGALLLECACGQARRLWRGGGEGWGCAHSPCPLCLGKDRYGRNARRLRRLRHQPQLKAVDLELYGCSCICIRWDSQKQAERRCCVWVSDLRAAGTQTEAPALGLFHRPFWAGTSAPILLRGQAEIKEISLDVIKENKHPLQ